eukprot:m.463583 g.463583  ORF g.463583 m.463583 type:complete len:384 (+) comp23094_c0_seq1:13-1164(+)
MLYTSWHLGIIVACAATVATLGTEAASSRNAASPDNRHHLGRLSAGAIANGALYSEDTTLNNFPPGGAVWKPATGSWNTPVLTANASSWEHTAVQEPQVIYIPEDKVLRMWYRGAGWGHPSGVGVAESSDEGRTWTKRSENPVWVGADGVSADCAGQPFVYRESSGKYWLFGTNNHPARLCIATSTDGIHWVNASATSASQVPLPPNGALFGNRAFWQESPTEWKLLQEVGVKGGVWEVFLYTGKDPFSFVVANGGLPLSDLQRHPGSMYGGCHIATVDGQFMPKDPTTGLYTIWYHAGAHGNLPTDIYHASSANLLNWTVSPATPVITHQGGGSFAFDQVADPSPLTVGATAYIAYDGDNNGCKECSHASIGLATAPVSPRK